MTVFSRPMCRCKRQPTPKPPKQCQKLVGEMCRLDEDCGEGGYCSRSISFGSIKISLFPNQTFKEADAKIFEQQSSSKMKN